ncbi:MFS transporter [Nocardia jiangsuensis]|uniref:MFS transporter n=1 Tax=Nocardia jiangsuensis TaxID=1691563 RepID=A0ABV8DYI6_9NOCA
MLSTTPAPPVRAARAAVFTVFALNGLLLSLWVVHIPAITDRTGVAPAQLGTFILLLAGAGIVGMRITGPLADRFGSRALVAAAAVLISLGVLGPGFATGPLTLALALAFFGFGNGALDVSMNTQAVHVERAYGRPIMSAFHALFSGGGFLGALIGAATQRAGLDLRVTLVLAAATGLLLTAALVPRLLRELPEPEPVAAAAAPEPRSARGLRLFALAAIAFVLLLTEGAAADWSALQVRDHLGTTESTAAFAFAAFSCTMTAGRLVADRVSGRFGPVFVVRWGCVTAGLGLALVVCSGWLPATLLGWALCGIGLSGGVPQIFTAAGNLGSGGSAGTDMSRVFAIGYVGLLAGPAIIGWLTELVPLTTALAVPLVLTLVCSWFAGVVAPGTRNAPARS